MHVILYGTKKITHNVYDACIQPKSILESGNLAKDIEVSKCMMLR